MARIVWDRVEDRSYEVGVDHGVLYIPNESGVLQGVPWNGLTKVTKDSTRDSETTYFDGVKIHNYVKQTEFSGSIDAIMYPAEFEELEGTYELVCGVSVGEQPPGLFSLCYRSQIRNSSGDRVGYRLHILYNLIATPADKNYETLDDSIKLMEFSWTLESIPELIPNFRPTAEVTIDSRKTDPWLLEELEDLLYGSDGNDPYLPSFAELSEQIRSFARLKVEVDANGVFTVTERRPGTYISENPDGSWEIRGVDWPIYDTYKYDLVGVGCQMSLNEGQVVISIQDLGNGLWTATTDYPDLISVTEDGVFTINDANVIFDSADQYRIANTTRD